MRGLRGQVPAWGRRLAALTRRFRSAEVEGVVDGCVAGEIRGWALIPTRPGQRVHVAASCEGRIVAQALADVPRQDLLHGGRGDGHHGFRLKLPADVLESGPHMVRVEAMLGARRERLSRGEVLVPRQDASAASMEPPAPWASVDAIATTPTALPPAQRTVALAVWGGDEAAAERIQAGWAVQDWPDLAFRRLRPGDDEGELGAWLGKAHTVMFAMAGDEVDPAAARILAQARPLADVVTWRGRPEARELGVLVGETLQGAFAVRGHVFRSLPEHATASPRRLELLLASRPELRWQALGAPISRPAAPLAGWAPIGRAEAQGLEGFRWLAAESGRPSRLAPDRTIGALSIGVWGPGADETVHALVALAPGADIEILAPAASRAALAERLAALGLGARLSVRPIDPPDSGGAGAWLRVLSEAATGDTVLLAHAGTRLQAGALEELAAWSLSPRAGAVTLALGALAGLRLARREGAWEAVSAHNEACAGQARPVLAAPSALLCVARDRLAAIGGVDDHRFPGAGADLDLALRLRSAGWPCLMLGHLGASVQGEAPPFGATGADLAPFDPAELGAAAAGFDDGGTS